MARSKGTFQFAANFEVKAAAALDPRVAVATKAELILKETWPYDGDTIYLYKGIVVSVADENALYMLIDTDKILSTDYSGWKRVDAGDTQLIEVVDNLTSDDADKALSAKQGKVLMGEIDGVKAKLVNIYAYKGSKNTYAELPTDAVAGDVWNVAEAHEGHPAGTNYAWTGTEWDALAGSIDLSNYYNKSEVDGAIAAESALRVAEEQRLAVLIEANTTLANEAKGIASENQNAISGLSQSVGNINLILNGDEDDNTDGVIGRLAIVEEKNNAQDTRLTALEKLISGGEVEGDTTLLEMVSQNTADISALKKVVSGEDGNGGLAKAVEILNGDSKTEGSVDYKIEHAFAWEEVE